MRSFIDEIKRLQKAFNISHQTIAIADIRAKYNVPYRNKELLDKIHKHYVQCYDKATL